MTKVMKLGVLAVLGAVLAGQAFATTIVAEADVNSDGMYSMDEMAVVYPQLTEDTFLVIDTSNDGLVDEAELIVATEAALLPLIDE